MTHRMTHSNSSDTDPIESLRAAPFHLDDEAVSWVRRTRDGMSTDDKVRQLFVLASVGDDADQAERQMALRPAGLQRMVTGNFERAWQTSRRALECAVIPPLLAGDLEGGGHSFGCQTAMPNQLGLAAADDLELSARVVRAAAREGRALGFNWSFTPVCDISAQVTSAIVGTRSYGSQVDTIARQTRTHVQALQAEGLAATAKHWPGEGFDPRDQHLVTTINPQTMAEWRATFGRIYAQAIDAGVLSVMAGHIALPAWLREHVGADGLAACVPASLSKAITLDLLRGELGFNGLVVSDAAVMAGLGSWADRATLVPQVIEAGCDIFLLSRHEQDDIALMTHGLREGRLSEQRLEQAVTRILGLKAALGLHRKSIDERLPPLEQARAMLMTPEHRDLADQAARQSVTLVKDAQQQLPLSPHRHRRVVLLEGATRATMPGHPGAQVDAFKQALSARGFELRAYDPAQPPSTADTDLVLYVMAQESAMNVSRIYIDWQMLQPGLLSAMERFWHDLPCAMVSFGHPYHLFDAPRMPLHVNAYCSTVSTQHAVVRKLLGEEPFSGVSPVDAFCGLPDAAF